MRRKYKRTSESAFAMLLVLLVSLVVIMVVATLAIPSILTAWRVGNRNAAIQTLKNIARAETAYNAAYSNGFRAPNALAAVGPMPPTCGFPALLNGMDALSTFGTFTFTYTAGPTLVPATAPCSTQGTTTYTLTMSSGDPKNKWTAYLDQTGVVRVALGSAANSSTPAWLQ